MPLPIETDDLISGGPATAVAQGGQTAPYAEQFFRGLAHGSTFGMWEPFKEAGKGGLTETLGRIAGTGASFIPTARAAGLGIAGLSKVPAFAKLLAPGISASTAAANMLRLGRQIGPSFAGSGAGLAIGGAIPLQSEIEAGIQRAKGEEPTPFKERMITSALAATLGGLAGRSMARGKFAIPATEALSRDSIDALFNRRISELTTRMNTASPEDAAALKPTLENLKSDFAAILKNRKTAPPGELGGEVPEIPYKNLDEYYTLKKPVSGEQWTPGAFGEEPALPFKQVSELVPPGVDESYASWFRTGGKTGNAIRPPTFGEALVPGMSGTEEFSRWQLQRIDELKRTLGPAADPVRIKIAQQLQEQGTPIAHDVEAMADYVNGSTFASGDVNYPIISAKPIGGGSVTSYPLSSDIGGIRSGFAPIVRLAARQGRELLGKFTQIAPTRWMVMGLPGLENLPDIMNILKLKERSTFGAVTKELDSVINLPKEVKATIKRLFGEYQNEAPEAFYQAVREQTPDAINEVNKLRDVLDRMWEYYVATGVLDRNQRILNYFPHVRDIREVRLPGVLELEKGTGTIPITIENMLKSFSPQFAKTRSITDPALVPTMRSFDDVLRLYVHQFSRFSALHEMTPDINEALMATPEIHKEFIANYMNYVLGKTQPNITQANQLIRNLNFLRAIGFNALSPVKNMMQMINTFSVTSPSSFFQAFKDMKDPAQLAKLDAFGVGTLIRGRSTWPEILEWDADNMQGMSKTLMNRAMETSGKWFSSSAEWNRLHAVLAGLREAEKKKLVGDQQMKFALSLMNQTQFHVGDQLANLPEAFRTGGGRLIGQFQTFRLNQFHFMTRLLDTAMDGARKGASGDIRGMVDGFMPFIKFWGPTIAITGPLGILPGDWAEDHVTRAVFGKAMHIPGLMETLFGVVIPSGLGIESLEARDLNSFLSYMPGPSVSYLQALVGTATGIDVGQGLDLRRVGNELASDARLRLGLTMLPATPWTPGGVQTNRILQALRLIQNDGEYQRAMDMSEFVGAKKPSGAIVADKASSLYETLAGAIGYQPAWRTEAFKVANKEREMEQDYRSTIRRGGQAIASGDQDEVQALLDKFNKRYEDYLPAPIAAIPRAATRRAFIEQNVPPALRRRLPLPLRGAEESLSPPPLFGGS